MVAYFVMSLPIVWTPIYPSVHSSSIVLYFAVKLKLYNSTCSWVHDLALNLGVKILFLALLVLIN